MKIFAVLLSAMQLSNLVVARSLESTDRQNLAWGLEDSEEQVRPVGKIEESEDQPLTGNFGMENSEEQVRPVGRIEESEGQPLTGNFGLEGKEDESGKGQLPPRRLRPVGREEK